MSRQRTARRQSIARRRAARTRRRHDRRRTTLRGPLPQLRVVADDQHSTIAAGVLPLIEFLTTKLRLPQQLRALVGRPARRRIHPVHLVLFAFVVATLAGARRMAHLDRFIGDAMLSRLLRLSYWPVRKVFASALANLSDDATQRLLQLVCNTGLSSIPAGTPSVVIDLDPTAIIDHGIAEKSAFGHCGKGRRRRRHYPLVASVAQGRSIVGVQYRGGNNLTAKELTDFLSSLTAVLRRRLGPKLSITIRGDAGLFSAAVQQWLDEAGIGFVMALSMRPAVKANLDEADYQRLDDDGLCAGLLDADAVNLPSTVSVAIVRRVVHDSSAPPQGKRVAGHEMHRYQAVVSNQRWSAAALWRFYNGRADCERIFRVGKQVLGMDHLVSRRYRANEVAFLLRCLAYNVDVLFAAHCEQRARKRRVRVHHEGLESRQPNFYRSPGRLTNHGGRWVLHVPDTAEHERRWRLYAPEHLGASEGSAAA